MIDTPCIASAVSGTAVLVDEDAQELPPILLDHTRGGVVGWCWRGWGGGGVGGEGASGNRGTFINVTFSVQAYTSISSTKSAYICILIFLVLFS